MDPISNRRGNPNMRPGMPSINPSGRPRGAAGIAHYVAEQTSDGRELVDRLLAISRGDKSISREAREATMALIDRMAGKPITPSVAHVISENTGPTLPPDFRRLSLEERREILDSITVVG
jgi:hypothetical protein